MLWNAKNGAVKMDGTVMRYVSFGHGGKRLVILPGLSEGLATVKGKALLLAPPYRRFFEDFTVYMFGRKDVMPDGYSIRDMAADQARAMRTLGMEGSCVMGVSQGGMIAEFLAADHPDLVEKVVLTVTAPYANGLIRENVTRWIGYAEKKDHKALMVDTAERSYSPATLKKIRLTYPVIGHVGKPKDYGRFLANARAILEFDARSVLKDIACPTLVIGGCEDRIVGADASRELHEKIPGSGIYLYEGLGHSAYEEAKDYNARVLDFFRTGAL